MISICVINFLLSYLVGCFFSYLFFIDKTNKKIGEYWVLAFAPILSLSKKGRIIVYNTFNGRMK